MVFSSTIFLFIYLPVALILYYSMPGQKTKNIMLALLSVLFYAWGEPVWAILLILSAVLHFACGWMIERFRGKPQAKAAVVASIVISIGLLVFFKYANFIVGNLNAITGLHLPETKVKLPIGISFYTFQTLSYSIDAYKGNVKVQRSFWSFLLFVSLFPQLIAGPILRYSDIEMQLSARRTTLTEFVYGTTRFLCGLAKKVLIANYAGAVVERLFAGSLVSAVTVLGAWIGIVLYAFQIYFDFSGYSDMAIGLGSMFGFSYPENFNRPYISKSITEFWRRWHISLGTFFRDYVYIPLGGNRRSLLVQARNMLIVWSLTGLWHGASWNFVIWGLWFFVFLFMERLLGLRRLGKIPAAFRLLSTFVIVLFGWVFFYFTNLSDIRIMLFAMLGQAPGGWMNSEARLILINNIPLLLLCFVAAAGAFTKYARRLFDSMKEGLVPIALFSIPTIVYNTSLLVLCSISLLGSTHNPFIYFRF